MVPLRFKLLFLIQLILEEYDKGFEALFHPHRYLYSSFDPSYKRKSISQKIWELTQVGDIRRVEKGGKVFFEVTSQGKKKIKYEVPLLRFRRKWDGLWRLVIFDIAEEERVIRDLLRRKLKSLGFGQWQKSIWITPFDIGREIDEFLEYAKVKGPVEVLEAKRLYVSDEKALAERIWKLDKLNKEYKVLVTKWGEAVPAGRQGKEKWQEEGERLTKLAASLQEEYLDLLWKDPGLPYDLLPSDWVGDEGWEPFKEWIKVLSS